MGFYNEISKYYDYIFPFNKTKLEFFEEVLGDSKEISVLDIGTSTGTYAVNLAKKGYQLTGIDLNEDLLEQCRQKAEKADVDLEILNLDMKDLSDTLTEKFNGIICIGNTLVHLSNFNEIADIIRQMYKLLEPQGKLIVQIVNYDRILKKEVKELPLIKRKEVSLTFIRKYKLIDEGKYKDRIDFNTTLKVDGKTFKNSIPLYPLTSQEIINILEEVGFNNYSLYGGFDFSAYNPLESGSLVLVAEK
ncbi:MULTISPECIES: class I SAM-dependent methyltransferase [unclassified Candidatus Frackibacter]|uniref:class I SAM-dependent methyltransferase n=1 Tax=unclassified Candidatus Frackibacter TaxID=2648818 RepID=UPI00088E587E|nr:MULTISPECIES: class I SAM-dependent methyltransferase [unclassified Candidatus Frackibacter]SDC26409.1 Methyltransferase domain-containing protein [Candidatus Frackibacter sp. WG11]SFL55081.1 Methyltransferase domain-containing protein [Candidatus Frackibacter sp. WG13]